MGAQVTSEGVRQFLVQRGNGQVGAMEADRWMRPADAKSHLGIGLPGWSRRVKAVRIEPQLLRECLSEQEALHADPRSISRRPLSTGKSPRWV